MASGLASWLRGPALHQLSAGIQPCRASLRSKQRNPVRRRLALCPSKLAPLSDQSQELPSLASSAALHVLKTDTYGGSSAADSRSSSVLSPWAILQSLDSHFTEGEAEAQRAGRTPSKVTQLGSGKAGTCAPLQEPQFQSGPGRSRPACKAGRVLGTTTIEATPVWHICNVEGRMYVCGLCNRFCVCCVLSHAVGSIQGGAVVSV